MKTLRYLVLLGAVLAVSVLVNPAFAQDMQAEATSGNTQTASSEEPAAETSEPNFKARLALAKEMHEIRPAADQVDSAIDSVALQMPENARNDFKAKMRNLLNYRAIENISINAMANTYTLEELEAMVEYYSNPVAQSAIEKTGIYQQKVGPEIARMIDRALMQMRTGGAN